VATIKKFVYIIILCLGMTCCREYIVDFYIDRAVENISRVKSFDGIIEERGLLPEDEEIATRILFKGPDRIRAEIVSPEKFKGNIFVYDGRTIYLYNAGSRFGIRIEGFSRIIPDSDDLRIRRLRENLYRGAELFDIRLRGHVQVTGRDTSIYTLQPKETAPCRWTEKSWMDIEFSTPIRFEMYDAKKIIYGFRYKKITFNANIPDEAFQYRFPRGTTIGAYYLTDRNYTLQQIRRQMNFHLFTPVGYDPSMKLKRAVRSRGIVPSACLIYYDGMYYLMLIQVKDYGLIRIRERGIHIPTIEKNARLNFSGETVILSWKKQGVLITLTGNLPSFEMIAVAETMK
jgi:outer membrane lipoprotein-sorting protein